MIRCMLHRLVTRQIVSLVLALGMILGVTLPAWAATPAGAHSDMVMSDMAMPGMAMSADCMDTMLHSDKNLPAKNTDKSCGLCVACGLPIAAALLTEGSYLSSESAFTHDANRTGIAILPALPPPIA